MKPILVVKDRALDSYNQPFVQSTTAQGVRGFTDEINNRQQGNSGISAHPDDYDLYVIGHYNEQTAEIVPLKAPELVVRGKDVVRPTGE